MSSFNSVNSASMCNIEIMLKMVIIITIILTAIMVKVFNHFHMSAVFQGNKNFRKEVTKNSHSAGKNWMLKKQSFSYCNRKVNASSFPY